VAGSGEYGYEPSDSIKGGEFLDYLSDFSLSRGILIHGVGWLVS